MRNPEGIDPSDGKPEKPYEKFYASERYVEMADAILAATQTRGDSDSKITTEWQDKNDNYYTLVRETKSQKHLVAGTARDVVNYWLRKYSPYASPGGESKLYALTQDGHVLQRIRTTDFFGNYQFTLEAAKEALEILSEKVPAESKKSLQKKFDETFVTLAGVYILSNLAVVPDKEAPTTRIDEEVAIDATVKHIERIDVVEKVTERQSQLELHKDDPLRQELVLNAINSLPVNGRRHSSYIDVGLAAAAKSVAKGLGGHWKNVVVKTNRQEEKERIRKLLYTESDSNPAEA